MSYPKARTQANNQIIIEDGAQTIFQSYESTIIAIEPHPEGHLYNDDLRHFVVTVFPHYDYSATTSRHLNRFLSDELMKFDKKYLSKVEKTGTHPVSRMENHVYHFIFEDRQP